MLSPEELQTRIARIATRVQYLVDEIRCIEPHEISETWVLEVENLANTFAGRLVSHVRKLTEISPPTVRRPRVDED